MLAAVHAALVVTVLQGATVRRIGLDVITAPEDHDPSAAKEGRPGESVGISVAVNLEKGANRQHRYRS